MLLQHSGAETLDAVKVHKYMFDIQYVHESNVLRLIKLIKFKYYSGTSLN